MKKSTKGALAAAAAGSLLLGGAGSLAFWSESTPVDGGDLASGSITLSNVVCAPSFTHTEAPQNTVSLIVPGDTITKRCTGTLVLVGDHIGADVEIDPLSIQSLDGSLGSEIDAEAVLTAPAAPITAAGSYNVTVDINVEFPDTVTSETSQTSTASLNALTLVATQTHN